MPLPASLVHDIAKHIDQLHKANDLTGFGPDGKIQASVRYKDGKPEYIDNLIISVQHSATIDYEELCNHLKSSLLATVIPDRFVSGETHFLFRAKVGFIDGGPKSDCGLSGRKVISDTYGSWARHGGGGLSGKDPSKIDRCATYAARYMAKNLVAAGLAERCEVQLAYMIGLNEPLAVSIDFQGTGKVSEDRALDAVKQIFPLEPEDIIQQLRLRRPIYRKAGIYGHFGHTDPDFSWERTDRVDDILQRLA
jgi:S-adenosylmethionine synthetase